jgi:hypothetical protein
MNKYEDQYAAARRLVDDPCDTVSSIARTLYCQMLKSRATPDGFNDLYFFQAVIRVWLSEHSDIELKETQFPLECKSIKGINWPAIDTCRHELAKRFVDLAKSDSVSAGDVFDVGYAVKIIESSFDEQGKLRCCSSAELKEIEYDYWLSGFNSNQS